MTFDGRLSWLSLMSLLKDGQLSCPARVAVMAVDICFLKSNIFLQNKKRWTLSSSRVFLSETGRSRTLVGGATVTVEQVPGQTRGWVPRPKPARGDSKQQPFFFFFLCI